MNLSEVNDLFTGTFPSVIMSDMTEYWKDFLSIFHTLLLSIYANHFTIFFHDLMDSQPALLSWLTIYGNQYSCWSPNVWSVFTNLLRDLESF